MHISKVGIRNYRSCGKTEVRIDQQLSCFVGQNGAGKTSFLSAVNLLRRIVTRRRAYNLEKRHVAQWSSEIGCQVQFDGIVVDFLARVLFAEDRRSEEIDYIEDRWKITYDGREPRNYKSVLEVLRFFQLNYKEGFPKNPNHVIQLPTMDLRSVAADISGRDAEIILRVADFFGDIRYYGASKFTDPSRAPNYLEIDPSRGYHEWDRSEHAKFIHDLYKTSESLDQFYEFKRIVCDDLGLLSNIEFSKIDLPSMDVKVLEGVKVKTIEYQRNMVIPKFVLNNGKEVSPSQLSEGTFKTIASLFYLITDDSKVVLLEEPEVCIHHGLLEKMIDIVKSFSHRKQIFISTHSEFVLDLMDPESVYLVRNSSDSGTSVSPLSDVLSRNHYAVLKRYLNDEGTLGEYLSSAGPELFE